jgi:hypothetical protein
MKMFFGVLGALENVLRVLGALEPLRTHAFMQVFS